MKMRTKQAERGMAVVAATVMLVLLIPVTGLAIDVTLLYVDKARLQGAADGAALAGAESLSRGTTDAAQQLAAQQAAAEYVFLNYPSSFFFTNSVTVCYTCTPSDVQINETVANQRTVTVYAHANVPTLFMRWLNFTSTNVNASASVNRRDVNVMFVMDRSGSLQNSGPARRRKLLEFPSSATLLWERITWVSSPSPPVRASTRLSRQRSPGWPPSSIT